MMPLLKQNLINPDDERASREFIKAFPTPSEAAQQIVELLAKGIPTPPEMVVRLGLPDDMPKSLAARCAQWMIEAFGSEATYTAFEPYFESEKTLKELVN